MNIFQQILLGGGATLIATQILKSDYIPVQFEKYPRATTVVVALISALIAEYQAGALMNYHNIASLGTIFVGTLLVAITVYNQIAK